MSRATYTHAELLKLQQERGYLSHGEELERKRCEADLVYAMHNAPEQVLDQDTILIDKILHVAIAIRKRKYGDISQDVADTDEFITSPQADHWIKLFQIYAILYMDGEEMGPLFAQAYVVGDCLFEKPQEHLQFFMANRVIPYMNMALNFPYSDNTVIPMVRDLIKELKQSYLIE